MNKIWTRRNDERGAILVMSTVGFVLAVIAAALAVDLGTLAQERRRDQKVADLTALDAVRDIAAAVGTPGSAGSAQKIAQDRNTFPSGAGYSVAAVEGNKVGGTCVAASGSGRLCVTVTSPHKNNFVAGDATVQARAVAGPINKGSFSIGSSVASLDTNNSVLDQFIGRWVKAPGTIDVVSYNGLASANVTLSALQTQLLAAGLDVGTVDKLLNTSMSVRQILTATAQALGPGNPAAAVDVNNIALAADSTLMLKLGNLISVAQGSENAALATQLNVFRLISGSAAVANGTNTVTIPSLTVSIAGVAGVTVSLKVIEAPKIYIGPTTSPTPHAQTSQVELSVTPTLNASALVATVTGQIPISVIAGKATGNLAAVTCGSPKRITVDATTGAGTVSATTTLGVTLPVFGNQGNVLNVNITGNAGSGSFPGQTFTYAGEYGPPGKHVGNTTAGLGTLLSANTSNGLVNAVLASILSTLLRPLFNAIDTAIVRPLLQSAGADLGTADIIALPIVTNGIPDGAACGDYTLLA